MGVLKLGDFGLASELEESCTKRQDVFGTSLYMAPEVYEEGAVLKSDVWSLGISLIEMGEGKNPYAGRSRMMIMKEVLTQPPPSLSPSKWSSEFVDFVNRCLVKDVEGRGSVEELMGVR